MLFRSTARAAGSAGYMVAILLQGSLLADQFTLSKYHLFIASACAAINALFVALFYLGGIGKDASSAPPITKEVGVEANRQQSDSTKSNWVWYSLVALFWMIAFCESAYGLYSHEFLSRKYQSLGYYLFSGGILIEIVILLALPYLPKSTKQLLFTGPLGWFFVFSGCLLADQIAPAFGLCCLLMALNCPFQVACQETSHAIRPRMSGMASLGLAQAFGIVCAAWSSAVLNLGGQSPAGISEKQSALPWETLWQAALLVALSGLVLSLALNRTMSQSVRRSPDYQS